MTKQQPTGSQPNEPENGMFAAIESGKYVTEKDRVRDIEAIEEQQAQHIVNTM